jgi:hypothetical protein
MRDYIGDGVYAEWDGFGIWLYANSPGSDNRIYLEPEVLEALNKFAKRCAGGKRTAGDSDGPTEFPGPTDWLTAFRDAHGGMTPDEFYDQFYGSKEEQK